MEDYWAITIPLLLASIGGLTFWGLKSYIGKKLENIATSQDIEGITKAVEGVKKAFQDDTERLKSQLNVLTNKHNILFTEEKEALIAYLSAWNIWHSNLNRMVSNYNTENYPDLEDILKAMDRLKNENNKEYDTIQNCLSKLELFLNDDKIIDSIYTLNARTYEFQILNENYIDNFIWNNHHKVGLISSITNGIAPDKATTNSIREVQEKMSGNYKQYNENMLAMYNNMSELKATFIRLSKDYIRKGIA